MKNFRLILVFSFFTLCFVGITIRLYYWQIISYERFSALAQEQHFSTINLPSSRGKILDREKNSLVDNERAYLLYADLGNIKKTKTEIPKILAPLLVDNLLDISSEEQKEKIVLKEKLLTDLINKKDVSWIALGRKINIQTKETINNFKISGLIFEEEEKRFYPEGSMSAQLLGFVGKDQNGEDQGYFGLEGFYNLQLKGKEGKIILEKDALGRPIVFGEQDEKKASAGRSLILTIDKSIQLFVEKHLKEGIEQFGAKSGNVIVMNPQTGEILAMSSFPAFNPSSYNLYNENLYQNPVVSENFEPGSIMKPLIMSVALAKNKVTPETKCPLCSGPREIGGYLIKTFNEQYHPNINMTDILVNSDNTGMVYIGDLLGEENIYEYLYKYGFGNKTGIDLEGENEGEIKPLDNWYPIDWATATFGQGIAVTPIQMIRAFSVLANGGYLVKPYLVAKIVDNQKEIDISPNQKTRIFKTEVTKTISQMLVNVANKSPLHFPKDTMPELSRYQIAAKSGTAQIPLAGHYDSTKTIGSVIGYAPADNPKFIVLVRLVEPTVRPWGSDTAGPIFFKIIKDLLIYYNIGLD